MDDEKKAESQNVLLAGHLNLSMVYLKLKDNSSTVEHATKAIAMDGNNVKAYFRRGQVGLHYNLHNVTHYDIVRVLIDFFYVYGVLSV